MGPDFERELRAVLDRGSAYTDFEALHDDLVEPSSLQHVAAIGFDTNILKNYRLSDAVEAEVHLLQLKSLNIATILPGQVWTEFWNNHRVFTDEDLKKGKSQADALRKLIETYGLNDTLQIDFDAITAAIDGLIKPGAGDESTVSLAKSQDISRVFTENCTVPFVSREGFHSLAQARLHSKTPPGFGDAKEKTAALGDFYVWSDFLLGLRSSSVSGSPVSDRRQALFISNDGKDDWVTGGRLHPALQNECYSYTGLRLTILNYSNFRKLMKTAPKSND